ncbi:hypothetical protein DSUL_60318 [Desulfovibrionales bacterium]
MNQSTSRHNARLAGKVVREIAEILLDAADPRLATITVSGVRVSETCAWSKS